MGLGGEGECWGNGGKLDKIELRRIDGEKWIKRLKNNRIKSLLLNIKIKFRKNCEKEKDWDGYGG